MSSVSSNEYGIVLLAAGASTRLGRPKQLLLFEGSALVKRAATLALEISNKLVVVTGAHAEKLEEELGALPLQMIHNSLFEEGIASSIRTGIMGLAKTYGQTGGAIFIACDQPYLRPGLLRELIDTAQKTNKGIVASAYASTLGIPVLFQQQYFDQLMELKGDTGAKKLINDHREDVAFVDFPRGEVDIDSTGDYEALLKKDRLP